MTPLDIYEQTQAEFRRFITREWRAKMKAGDFKAWNGPDVPRDYIGGSRFDPDTFWTRWGVDGPGSDPTTIPVYRSLK